MKKSKKWCKKTMKNINSKSQKKVNTYQLECQDQITKVLYTD
ncbi:hypothetical protein RSD73_02595 [Mycoplasmopsis bovis]|nr:hypothetical protein [Mycoplasmopsis bovis]WNV99828.1 hypothetical protein RSD73_02650 [Mycoplasmopsis bovis]WNW00634.1 hypothetical protein RSD73_02595 [Mycoplasmopsis bovis]